VLTGRAQPALTAMEAKQTMKPARTPQHCQRHQQPAFAPLQQFSIPVPASSLSQSISMEFTMPVLYQQATLSDLDRLLDDSDIAGNNNSR